VLEKLARENYSSLLTLSSEFWRKLCVNTAKALLSQHYLLSL